MLFIYLPLVLALLIWGVVILRTFGLLVASLAVLLVGSCFGHPFFHAGPVTLDRLLLVMLIALYPFALRLGWAERKPLGLTEYLLMAYLGALAFSTFTHDWTIEKSQPVATLLFFFVLPGAAYWLAREARCQQQQAWIIGVFLAGFSLYLATTGIFETKGWHAFIEPRYIVASAYTEFFGRARGPFLNPIGCGLYLCAGLAGAWSLWPEVRRGGRTAILAVTLYLMVGTYCTLTRSVWMGAALGAFIVTMVRLPRQRRLPAALVVGCLGLVAVLASWSDLQSFKRDRAVSEHEMAQSAELRPILAAVAWNMFLDRPLLGFGFGHYRKEATPYVQSRDSDLPLSRAQSYVQHNVFLAHLTDTGLVGMGLLIAVCLRWAYRSWRLWRDPGIPEWVRQQGVLFFVVLLAYIINGMFHDISIIPIANMLLFTLAGVMEGLCCVHLASVQRITTRLPQYNADLRMRRAEQPDSGMLPAGLPG